MYLHRKQTTTAWDINSDANWSWKITSNPTESGYDEDTSLENYCYLLYCIVSGSNPLDAKNDSVFVRNEMKILFDAKAGANEAEKWANCTEAEKDALAKCFIVSMTLVDERLNTVEKEAANDAVFLVTRYARQHRISKLHCKMGLELTVKADRVDLFNTVKDEEQAFIEAGSSDIIDYMNSQGVYDSTTGFEAKSYYSTGVRDLFNQIVRDGL